LKKKKNIGKRVLWSLRARRLCPDAHAFHPGVRTRIIRTCVASFEIPKLQQLSGVIIIYINVLFFLSVSVSVDSVLCASRSLASITTVNGKTGIDNLLLVIYQRYFFMYIIFYLFVFTLEVILFAMAAQQRVHAQSANDDEVIFIIYFDQQDKHIPKCFYIYIVYNVFRFWQLHCIIHDIRK